MIDRKNIKWGIIGLGNIANKFATDLALVDDAELYAVASRSIDKANSFAEQHNATSTYGSYEELMFDPQVDIIYVATPHDSHAELSIQSMENDKHVLCEKPIALNQREAAKMIEVSQRTNRFFMEAFWTRFNPSIREMLQKVQQGEIGEIKYINADFAFVASGAKSRLTNMENGGGALLDIGVYPLFLSYSVLGMPEKVQATSSFYETGADKETSMILEYSDAQSVLYCGLTCASNMDATIHGSSGRINIHPIWHETEGYSIIKENGKEDFHHPTKGKGFTYEIEECHSCIRNNKTQSDLWSHQNSLDLITIADQVREQIGLIYPPEQ